MLADEREQLVSAMWRSDAEQFYTRSDVFGRSRLEIPAAAGARHSIVSRRHPPMFVVDRFLVGNKTAPFSARAFRTSYIPLVYTSTISKTTRKDTLIPDKQTYLTAELKTAIRRFFGEDFKTVDKTWLVQGFKLKAEKACLTCHTWAKEGDALGYLVYAVGGARTKVR